MNWIKKNESTNIFTSKEETKIQNRKIRKIAPFESPIPITTLSQFFLSLSAVNGPDNVLHIPTLSDESLFQKALTEIGGHFVDIKAAFVDDKPQQLILKEIQKKVVEELQNLDFERKLNPIVANLFNTQLKMQYSHREKKTIFRVIPSEVIVADVPDFDETMEFLCKSYDDLLITPTNWYLTNELKDSIAIRYFAHRCKNLYLWVDDLNSEIIYIHLET
ncbi:hypothetical protein [Brevibacillus brevis]|uniref:hypothetical protein n=1 Tax=Brevibacillus brevis TaxID=1393 RepID=UPI0037C8C655